MAGPSSFPSLISSSSPSSTSHQEKHDVFLSFRGQDTRKSLTSHLFAALEKAKIQTFMDNDGLHRGEAIAPSLLKAIEESKVSVIIFSENYADSRWCLDELVKIMECKKNNGQIAIPVFYQVSASNVRRQTKSYEKAFDKLKQRYNDDQIQKWRDVLREAADLSGWSSSSSGDESKLIEQLVGDILKKLNRMSPIECSNLVGIDSRIKEVQSILRMNDTQSVVIVGIWGMGGSGKTAIAGAVFNQIYMQFEGFHFLSNVSEELKRRNEADLRNKVISNILEEENLNLNTPNLEQAFIKDRLRRKKVLLVLDDVDDTVPLENLLGEPNDLFGQGSRIIITSRDKRVLKSVTDDIYEVQRMDIDEALEHTCIGHENSKQPTDKSTEPNDLKSDGMGIPVERVPEDVSTVPPGIAVVLIKVEGAVISLIDGNSNLELARDDLYIIKLSQGDDLHTVFVRIGDDVQWMLTKDATTTFKLRDSLYLFNLNLPKESEGVASSSDEENEKDDAANITLDSDGDNDSDDTLMYSLTTEWKGQDDQMKEFDGILQTYSNFEVHETHEQVTMEEEENVENGSGVKETWPEDKKEIGECQAHYRYIQSKIGTYTGRPAKLVARGSAELIMGILKSGDSTLEMLKWVDQVMKKKMNPKSKSQINPKTMRRIRRVKRMTKTTEKVVTGVLAGVVTATSTFNRMVLETKVAKKLRNFSTAEFVRASFEGINNVCDAVEVVGKNVLSKSSNVTTGLVNQRYGEEAAEATREGLGAAGHALGTAFAAFSIRKAFDPSNVIKSSNQIGNSNSDVRSARGLRAKLFK